MAPLPVGAQGHFGPELRRFALMQHHQGQVTIGRLATQLAAIGLTLSKRQLRRLLTADKAAFLSEDRDVLRAGLETAPWISTDDTGVRHKGRNGVCTQIGNDDFTGFATTGSKSRLNFLGLLRGGHDDTMVNDAAMAYMHQHHLAAPLIARLAAHQDRRFEDEPVWAAHLQHLGLTDLKAYRVKSSPRRKAALQRQFDSVFTARTGYASLDRPLRRRHANKKELLVVLDRPEIPLHT